jgi:hypothetical protein
MRIVDRYAFTANGSPDMQVLSSSAYDMFVPLGEHGRP